MKFIPSKSHYKFTAILVLSLIHACSPLSIENGNVTLDLDITENDGIFITLTQAGGDKLSGHIGSGISLEGFSEDFVSFASTDPDVKLSITNAQDGFGISWESSDISRVFQDCFTLDKSNTVWLRGREGDTENWPIQDLKSPSAPHLVSTENDAMISEAYWLNSNGVFIFVNETTPLFVDQNTLADDSICFIAKIQEPYLNRGRVYLNYSIAAKEDSREAHLLAITDYLGRPSGQPNSKMIKEPVWSTAVKYQKDMNDQLLMEFAQGVHDNQFRGQVQIEDGWEQCYGSLTFDKTRFPDIERTVMNINGFALRVTLWVHPFVNTDCSEIAQVGIDNGYFVKDKDESDAQIPWWDGENAYLIDFTNAEAQAWFFERAGKVLDTYRLDGFKFDAGEASWIPQGAALKGDVDRIPNEMTAQYSSISNLTDFVHVRSGWRTQWLPVFTRIAEKQPNWSRENGLRSVIINMIQLNLAGYTMAQPGLIGGKGPDPPSAELYVRWVQAVTFMPVMEFGFLPWEVISFQFDVLQIVKKFVDLHNWYGDKLVNVIRKSKSMGLPVNAPVWWIDPTNPDAFLTDDQYMLGEDFLIAPVLTEGATSRDVYLPPGTWEDGNNYTIKYQGPTTLKDYPAPIDVLPYFTKEKEDPPESSKHHQ